MSDQNRTVVNDRYEIERRVGRGFDAEHRRAAQRIPIGQLELSLIKPREERRLVPAVGTFVSARARLLVRVPERVRQLGDRRRVVLPQILIARGKRHRRTFVERVATW